MMDQEKLPYKSREITIETENVDQELWDITTGRKFRLMSLKIVNPSGANIVAILKDDTTIKETISVPANTTFITGEYELKGIEFEGDIIYGRSDTKNVIIRIGGLEY